MQAETFLALGVAIIAAAVILYLALWSAAARKARRKQKRATVVPDHAELLAIQNAWHAPPELSMAVPRTVRLTGYGKFLLVFMALIVGAGTVASAFILRVAFRDFLEFETLKRVGLEGRAEVVSKPVVAGKSTSRYVGYRFRVEGRSYQRGTVLSRNAYDRVHLGDRVAVRYLPSDPWVSRLSMENRPAAPWLGLVIPVLIVLVPGDRKSTRLNSSHIQKSRMPSSA